jgi:iron(III) transport system ATP-binding protein
VRPAATRILAADVYAPQGSLPGTVTDVAYRGRGYDHVVSCAAGALTAVFDPRRRTRGNRVEVALDPTAASCTDPLDRRLIVTPPF